MNSTAKKPGCLSILLPILRSKGKPATEVLPYRLRDDFLSPAEFSFFKVLSSVLGTRFIVQSKVRLADIFFVVPRSRENVAYFNKIAQRHLDFLVCDAITMRPLLGIELDDSSHQHSKRQERDEFVAKVFQAAGFPLLRFPAQREYNPKEIAARIAPVLKSRIASSGESQAISGSAMVSDSVVPGTDAPICPKCGVPMVLRTVTQGKYQGRQFYGCVNFPRCREVRPVPTQKTG